MRGFQFAERERIGGGDFREGNPEEAAVVEVSEDRACGLADAGLDQRQIELVIEVLLEGFRRDDIVIKALAALLVFLRPLVVAAFEDGAVAPIVVGLVHVFQRVRLIRIGRILVERGNLGDVLQGRIRLQRLPKELGKLHRIRLQDLQALAHLRRERLGLGEGLMERGFCHGRGVCARKLVR